MASAPPPAPLSEDDVKRLTAKIAMEKGIPPQLLEALIRKESMGSGGGGGLLFNPAAVGDKGRAFGLGQLHRGAMTETGMDPSLWADPSTNVGAAADYLNQQKARFSDWPRAVAAYNAGPGAVRRGDVPASTQAYTDSVLGGSAAGAPRDEAGPGFPPPPYEDEARQMSTDVQPNQSTATGMPKDQGTVTAEDTFIPPPGMEDLQGGELARSVPGGFGRTPSIVEIAGAKEPGGGFGGLLKKIGGGLSKALPYLLGGPYYAMTKHVVGPLAEDTEKRMEDWKAQREQKTKWENAQVDAASKMMEDLQGLNLTALLEQEKDPAHRALLQQAADRIHQIGKKYADFMSDPQSPGMITPKEAAELLTMKSMFADEITAAKEASGMRGSKMAGVAKGMETAGQEGELQRRAAEGDELARAEVAKRKTQGTTIPIEVGGGKSVDMTPEQASAWLRGMYYANADQMRKDPNSQMAQQWMAKNAMLIASLEMDRVEAARAGRRGDFGKIDQQIRELEEQLRDIRSGRYGSTSGLPKGYTIERDQQ